MIAQTGVAQWLVAAYALKGLGFQSQYWVAGYVLSPGWSGHMQEATDMSLTSLFLSLSPFSFLPSILSLKLHGKNILQ